MAGTFTLTPQTRVTLSMVAAAATFAYWLIGLAQRIDAAELRAARVETEQVELKQVIVQSLHDQSDQLSSLSVDVAGIEARLGLLIEWSDMKRKRTNQRP